jgi:hypothetical protein
MELLGFMVAAEVVGDMISVAVDSVATLGRLNTGAHTVISAR